MHSTAALSGSTLQVMPTHTYYYAGSGIAIDSSTNTISNTAQGSPPWNITVFNGSTEYPISGTSINAIKFPYQMTYTFTAGVLQLFLPDELGGGTTYTSGNGISINGTEISSHEKYIFGGQVIDEVDEVEFIGVTYQEVQLAGGKRMQITVPSATSTTYAV